MKVWVLTVIHKHGYDVSAHTTQEGAHGALASYVGDWWDQEMSEELIPDDDGEAIDRYFAKMSDAESYSIDECELEGAIPAQSNEVQP
jgi:hypothetical protein